MGAGWTLENVSDTTPGGTIATRGNAEVDSDWQVEIQYISGSSPQTLTSHSGQTAYMGVNWNYDFDPSTAYNPPSTWPVTGGDSNKLMCGAGTPWGQTWDSGLQGPFYAVDVTRGDGRRALFHDDGQYSLFSQDLSDEVDRSG